MKTWWIKIPIYKFTSANYTFQWKMSVAKIRQADKKITRTQKTEANWKKNSTIIDSDAKIKNEIKKDLKMNSKEEEEKNRIK